MSKPKRGGPRPSGSASSAPEHPFGKPYAGGDAWRAGGAPAGGSMAFRPPGGEYEYPTEMLEQASGTSIFDPVLCELVYRWFSPLDGAVLDPFAGGSVRGIVAAKLGRSYTGIDLRPEQLAANRAQAATICAGAEPRWIEGDSKDVASLAAGEYDLVFSCPPYGDLERYSDDPHDLSTMSYPEFLASYRAIIAASVGLLRRDRFACFVVGDFRGAGGFLNGFVGDTIQAFKDAGAGLYNEAILVTAVGSLPIRAGRQFAAGRKLGKTHQNVLVFCKGDPAKAVAACGTVEVAFPDGMLDGDPAQGDGAAAAGGEPGRYGVEMP